MIRRPLTLLQRSSRCFSTVQNEYMKSEQCIRVDSADNIVSPISKYDCHRTENIETAFVIHRAFSLFLFNENGQLLLQKRSKNKITFPDVWTNTCCSHPLFHKGEIIQENQLGVKNAAVRKVRDELGIKDLSIHDIHALGRIRYKAIQDEEWGENEIDYLLFAVKECEASPNPEEVSQVMYLQKEDLAKFLRENEGKVSPWFKLIAEDASLLENWWKRLEEIKRGEVGFDAEIVRLG